MTRRNPQLSLCALAVVALMAHGSSMAAPSDEELSRIKVYGNVTLAQDSASQWGPWEQFEAPNAGPAPVVFLPSAVAEVYRPVALVNPADSLNPCAAGGICGFGAFTTSSYGGQERSAGNSSVSTADKHPYAFTADVLEDNPLNVGEVMVKTSDALPPGLILHKQLLSTTGTLINPDSPPLGQNGWGYRDQDYSSSIFADTYLDDRTDIDPAAVQATWYWGNDSVQGGDGIYEMQSYSGVAGFVTTAEGMAEAQRQALMRESPIVNYVGHDYDAATNYRSANVQIAVNFGTRTFDATFNGGTDKSVQTRSTASGGTQLTGQVGFVASGNITGSTFQSTNVSATDAVSISGKVTGAFFGPNAAAAGGVADITKTRAASEAVITPTVPVVMPTMAQPMVMAMPTPTTQGYTNGRFVSPFLTVQENLIRSKD